MDAIDAISGGATATQGARQSAYSGLSSDDFVKIIFTELSKQDPLQPQDTGALLEQLSTIRNIESDISLGDQLGRLVSQNELASAAGLIGRTVTGLDASLSRVEGRVRSAGRAEGEVVLTLEDGRSIRMANLERVVDGGAGDAGTQDGDAR